MYEKTRGKASAQLEARSQAKAGEWHKRAKGDVAIENVSRLGKSDVDHATLADSKAAYEATLRKVKPADLTAALKECNSWRHVGTDLEKILNWHIDLEHIVEVQKILQAHNVTI